MPLSKCIGLPVNKAAELSHTSPTGTPTKIPRLPSEILAAIFVHYAHDDYSQNLGHSRSGWRAPDWVNVSYVCRCWRNAALSCSTLWTYVFFMSLRWTEELLARSKQMPLKIHIRPTDDESDEWCLAALKMVLEHSERIQEFRLEIPESWAKELIDAFSLRAPLLQELELLTDTGLSDVFQDFVPFDGDTPSLRTFLLVGYGLPWYSLKLSRLTTLNLECLPTEIMDMEDVLVALSCAEDLEHIYLTNALPQGRIPSADDLDALPKINLPRLSRLLIEESVPAIVEVLSRVNIPPNIEVRLKCVSETDDSPDDYALLASVLARRFYLSADLALPNLAVRSLVVEPYRTEVQLTFSALEHDHESYVSGASTFYTDWDRNIPLQIRFDPFVEFVSKGRISEFCCSMPLDSIHSLHVIQPPPSLDFWESILGHLQDLRCLKLSRGKMPKLASLLSLPSHDSREDPAEDGDGDGDEDEDLDAIFAPALEEVELDRISFAAGTPGVVSKLSSLKDALSTRHDPAVRLKMFNCDGSESVGAP